MNAKNKSMFDLDGLDFIMKVKAVTARVRAHISVSFPYLQYSHSTKSLFRMGEDSLTQSHMYSDYLNYCYYYYYYLKIS